MSDRPDPLEYEPVVEHDVVISFLPTMIAYCIVYMVVAMVAFVVAPKFFSVLRDFRTDISFFPRMTIDFCRWFSEDFGWLWLLPLPFAVPVAISRIPRDELPHPVVRRWRIIGLTSMVLLLIGVAMLLSLIIPVINLMDAVSRSK